MLPELGTPLATAFCPRTLAAFTVEPEQSIEKWPVELGCWSVTAHHRVEKKTPPSSDSSALHVTSVSIEECRHRSCLRTKNTLHDKSHVRGKGKELKGPVEIRRNEEEGKA